jgi:hypothetical protein
MKIKGIQNLSVQQIYDEIQAGGKFVVFDYTISIVVMTFKRPSDIYFIQSNENAIVKGLPFTFISLLLGWWGLPWGLIYTPAALYKNLSGGKDVTTEVFNFIYAQTNDPIFDFESQVTSEEEKQLEALVTEERTGKL